MQSGVFPEALKQSYIVAIHKEVQNNVFSELFEAVSGVPQGSYLGLKVKSPQFNYSIGDNIILRPSSVRDLGEVWILTLNADAFVTKNCLKGTRAFRVLMLSSKPFSDPVILRTLYCSMVWKIDEYASIAWVLPGLGCLLCTIDSCV
ncbi:hypothetical protein J6590_020281 [Homalodisca vitripennis]|nr:hypothetical protein J6590_020281 [Homalodisca vitripennis]